MFKWLWLLLLCACANASPVTDLNKIGQGEMQFLFWNLYEAEYYQDSKARALRITYLKPIKSRSLIDATIDQWRHLGFSNDEIKVWVEPLPDIWPDVEPGDTLTLRVTHEEKSQFYFNDIERGVINDNRFGDAFLAIWLSAKTSEPELRKALLGLNNE